MVYLHLSQFRGNVDSQRTCMIRRMWLWYKNCCWACLLPLATRCLEPYLQRGEDFIYVLVNFPCCTFSVTCSASIQTSEHISLHYWRIWLTRIGPLKYLFLSFCTFNIFFWTSNVRVIQFARSVTLVKSDHFARCFSSVFSISPKLCSPTCYNLPSLFFWRL